MKIEVHMTLSCPTENGYNTPLVVAEVLGKSLKENGVFEVVELNLEDVTGE